MPADMSLKAQAQRLLSGEAHLLLVVGWIANQYAVPYATALDWVLDIIDEQFGRD